jgi:hypothetical protein
MYANIVDKWMLILLMNLDAERIRSNQEINTKKEVKTNKR